MNDTVDASSKYQDSLPFSSDAILEQLDNWGIAYTRADHVPLRTVVDSKKVQGQFLSSEQGGGHIKNLYLRDNISPDVSHNGLLVPYTIPANTYVGQAKEVSTFGLAQVVFTDENADAELIYNFTKSFWENIGALQSSNTSFAGMSAELGSKMYDVPMHPGAARYFKEAGVN